MGRRLRLRLAASSVLSPLLQGASSPQTSPFNLNATFAPPTPWSYGLYFLLGAAIAAAILYAWLPRRLRKKWAAADASRARSHPADTAQARLASILEHTSDLVAFADADRNPLYVNAAGRRLLGLGATEDISGLKTSDLYPKWANELILREGLPTALREGVWRGQTAIQNRAGREIPVSQVITAHHKPDGTLEFTSTIIRDISALIQAVESVDSSEKRFRSLWESTPMGIYTYELQNGERLVLTDANPAADRILGVENRQFIGKTIEEAFPPLAATNIPDAYRRAASTGETWHSEQVDYEHGHIRGAFEVHAFQTGPNRMAVMFTEITVRKQAEFALREGEERFEQLANSISEVFYLVDWPERHFTYVSPAFENLWGRKVAELYSNSNTWAHAIPPADRSRVSSALDHHIESGEWTDQYRIERPDGSVRWIRDRAFAIRNQQGQVCRIAGVAEDISEQHRATVAEQAYRHLAQSLVGSLSLDDLGQCVAAECRSLFQHDAFFLNLIDPQTGQIEPVYAEDTSLHASGPTRVENASSPLPSELLQRLQAGKTTIVEHASPADDASLPAWGFADRRSASVIMTPMINKGLCTGLISIQSYYPKRYDAHDAELLQTLANQCASAVVRVRATEELRDEIRNLKQRLDDQRPTP